MAHLYVGQRLASRTSAFKCTNGERILIGPMPVVLNITGSQIGVVVRRQPRVVGREADVRNRSVGISSSKFRIVTTRAR